MEASRQEIVDRVTARLEKLGKSWAAMTEDLNESKQLINNWKNVRGIPPAEHERVARYLGWTVDELLGAEPVPEPAGWPFANVPLVRLLRLSDGRRLQLEGFMLDKLVELEGPSRKKNQQRKRPQTGSVSSKKAASSAGRN